MIITRSPLRISLGGGGTDLPIYYEKYGGHLIAATINKYVYINLHDTFNNEHNLKYSDYEQVKTIEKIKHPIFREIFNKFNPDEYIEISSMADIPAGTGMGSSGAFTCAVLLAMLTKYKMVLSKEQLAEEACYIEINTLKEPIGKQDQYASAFGGLNEYIFNLDGTVNVIPLTLSKETMMNLQSNLLIFSTGVSRSASKILQSQQNNEDIINKLHETKKLGLESKNALMMEDLDLFGNLMHKHWLNKKSSTNIMSNNVIDSYYEIAMNNGALGGKLIGAGGGGFLMFYTNYPRELRRAMTNLGLTELEYNFEFYGSQVVMI
jgi:D-glycero-alpha-D-manno-heptose-7-phosphate kinase